jgi:hypothetical protein
VKLQIFYFPSVSQTVQQSVLPATQWLLGTVPLDKAADREADRSPPFTAEVQNELRHIARNEIK